MYRISISVENLTLVSKECRITQIPPSTPAMIVELLSCTKMDRKITTSNPLNIMV
jgi:hypothetical protein